MNWTVAYSSKLIPFVKQEKPQNMKTKSFIYDL